MSRARFWLSRALLVSGIAAACKQGDAPRPVGDAAPARDAAAPVDAVPTRTPAYRAALAEGRDRAGQGDWPGAAAAFERARAMAPTNAVTASELGWTLFHAGDLATAERTTLASIAHASAPRLKAASLYNLGRIREAQGDAPSAADAYRTSLALRPNETVRTRLATLDRAVPAASGPLAPAPLPGPFADLGDWCEAQNQRSPDSPVTCDATRSGLAAGPDVIASPPRPLQEVRLVAMTGALDDVTCLLALRTAAGWWLHDGIPCETPSPGGRDWAAALALAGDDSAGRGSREARIVGRFLLSYAQDDDAAVDDGDAPGGHQCEEVVVVCGVGRSGRPSCTPNLTVAWAASCPAAPPSGSAPPPAPAWTRRGDVALAPARLSFARATGEARAPVELATGSHRLVFP
jgi:tetratricopeptide (TPR) repeat protein